MEHADCVISTNRFLCSESLDLKFHNQQNIADTAEDHTPEILQQKFSTILLVERRILDKFHSSQATTMAGMVQSEHGIPGS
jgi:hypothetical protein